MHRLTLRCLALVASMVQAVSAQPVADQTIESAWNEFEAVWHEFRGGTATGADLIAAHGTYIEPLDFARFNSRQLADLPFMVVQFGTGYGRVIERLEELLAENPADLPALIKYLELLRWARVVPYTEPIDISRERRAGLLDQILVHPELASSVRDATARLIPANLGVYSDTPEGLSKQRDVVDRLVELLPHEPQPYELSVALADHWDSLKDLGYSTDRLAELRARLLPRVQSTLSALQSKEGKSLAEIQLVGTAEQGLGYMTSPLAMRDVVGAPAPAFDIVWSSDTSVQEFQDLRGKPVLVEFWVTGCLHCIAAIPRMQEIAKRYQDTELRIIAVTSLQGSHHTPGEATPVDTEGHPTLEFELMEQFIESQGITWPVVFTEQSAWNPDYEVRGTPHLTLIDPEGNIAANDLHPQLGLASNSERIDAMLRQFGLAVPAAELDTEE